MANLAPDVQPTQDPYYLNMSKAAGQPLVNESGAIALKGAASEVEGGIKGIDETAKAYIKGGMQADLDPVTQERTDQLQQVADMFRVGTKPQDNNNGLMQADPQALNVPSDVKQFSPSFQSLTDLRANGRISQTDYIAKRDVILKDWRARFPGYRDFIDSEAERITGIPSANAYIRSLIEDINAATTNRNTERNKLESKILDNLDAVGVQNHLAWKNGLVSDGYIENLLAKRQAEKYTFEFNEKQRASIEGNQKLLEQATTKTSGQKFNDIVTHSFEDTLGIAGINEKKIADFLNGVEAGTTKVDSTQAQAAADALTLRREAARQQMRTEMYQLRPHYDAQGNVTSHSSWLQDLGGDPSKANAMIDNALFPYNHVIEMLTNEKSGPAMASSNYVARRTADAGRYFMTNPATKDAFTTMAAIDKFAPNYSKEWFTYAVQHGFQADWMQAIKEFTTGYGNPNTDPQGAETNTLADITKQALKDNAPQDVQRAIVSLPSYLERKDIPDQMKYNMAVRTFAGNNRGFLNNFEKDFTDQNGTYHVGQYQLYRTYTSEGKVNEVARLSDSTPDGGYLKRNFLNWNQDAFSTLARQSMLDLHDIPDKGAHLTYDEKDSRFHVYYDVNPDQGRLTHTSALIKGQHQKIEDTVRNLNNAIAGQVNVVKAFKLGDPNSVILGQMSNTGIDLSNVQGLPKQVMDELAKKKLGEPKAENFEGVTFQSRSPFGIVKFSTP